MCFFSPSGVLKLPQTDSSSSNTKVTNFLFRYDTSQAITPPHSWCEDGEQLLWLLLLSIPACGKCSSTVNQFWLPSCDNWAVDQHSSWCQVMWYFLAFTESNCSNHLIAVGLTNEANLGVCVYVGQRGLTSVVVKTRHHPPQQRPNNNTHTQTPTHTGWSSER